ncbi:immunity protein 53 of polymorphic toxin system [Rhizobium sp. PP-CC-3G-465]|nr:immunity protein 53 of polymorphic toxin system [Rhizobium sp. PP-CC-3G-465]
MDSITRLCAWFQRHSFGDWHEDHGIIIDTLDNPGWSLKIDLEGTELCDRQFSEIELNRSERDWLTARKSGNCFEAFGGPMNLEEMLRAFLAWTESDAGVDETVRGK